ncbi:MAG: hypothetical protein RBU37_06520 [Myxococcota bacterium]|jgi:hypothetical protein|nr:hypothetical protein [Myxococcota bacterium]
MRWSKLLILLSVFAWGGVAVAQDGASTTYVPEGEIEQLSDEGVGLTGSLVVGGSFNIAQNSSVVGQVDGYSLLLGANVTGSLDYIHLAHEWRNIARINQGWARTPVIDEFIKSNDVLMLESLYNYFVTSWFGPFGRLSFETAMLPAEDVRANPTTYIIAYNDGRTITRANQTRLSVASAFSPISLEQSVGVFAQPFESKAFTLSIRAGVGGRETLADGVLVLQDDDATDTLEMVELRNVFQAGAELFLGLRGKVVEDRLSWSVQGSVMFPFLNNDNEDRGIMELSRWAGTANLSVSVFSWMSLDYQLKLLLDPQLIDELQVQNSLLLTLNYTLIERKAPPPPPEEPKPDPEKQRLEEELKAAQQKALEAEAKAQEAEAKAREAELKAKQPEPAPVETTPDAPIEEAPEAPTP